MELNYLINDPDLTKSSSKMGTKFWETLCLEIEKINPNTIVELGSGQGCCTISMARVLERINKNGIIHSYDVFKEWGGYEEISDRLKDRGLGDFVKFYKGNVFETWVANPTEFDCLLIDICNTWESIYKIVIENEFVNSQIKKGTPVFIEGGAPGHPRINQNTLNNFIKKFDKPPFSFELIYGTRVSLSRLKLL